MELHDAEEAMGMRKMLARDIRMKKNPQTKKDTFWIFTDFQEVMQVQSPTHNPAKKFHQWLRSPQIRPYATTFSKVLY